MTRAALTLAALAAFPAAAAAQPTITYAWDWIEVFASTSTPVPSPNGVVEPGEGARLRLTTTISPSVGSTATYTPPPAPGAGTIAGLGSVFFDLLQTNALGGTWDNLRRTPGFAIGVTFGVDPDGTLRYGAAAQPVLPGSAAIPTNPLIHLWQATWTPATYTPRTASFQSAGAAAVGGSAGNHSAILIQYGPDPQNDPMYIARYVPAGFGGSGAIPIIPAPATLLPLAAAALLANRRRTL